MHGHVCKSVSAPKHACVAAAQCSALDGVQHVASNGPLVFAAMMPRPLVCGDGLCPEDVREQPWGPAVQLVSHAGIELTAVAPALQLAGAAGASTQHQPVLVPERLGRSW